MALSRKAKESIKVALAMTITYGIALKMDWDKPLWAGFAVAFVSLATVGQSFNKAALRMVGTLVATVVALTIIALFAQDRWLFMLTLSVWVGYCTYMMGGASHQYFWNVSGFVCIIVCMSGGPDSANAFNIAILRSQETGLGILVYSLVAIMLWPTRSRVDFDVAVAKLAATQHQIFKAFLGQMINKESSDTAKDLQAQLLQVQTRFGQLLEAAETDNYEVWEMRQQWERFQGLSADFAATVTGWQGSFIELQMLDIGSLIPDLETFGKELGQRFADIERMLVGQRPEHQPAAIDLALDETGVQSLSHFHRAALAVTHTRLLHLEVLSRSLFETVFSIQNFDQEATVPASKPLSHDGFVFDPDRLASVFRVMLTLWVTYIALIYIPDLPGGPGLVNMAGVFAMILAGTPQLPINMMYKPVAYGILFGAFIHIFVMPHFSSFYELGFLLFTVTFGISYLYAAPQQALSKIFGIAMFLAIAGIDNQQVYSLFGITTTATMFAIIFLMLSIIANIPFSASSEKVFLRLLSRYFHSCGYLVHNVSREEQKGETRLDHLQKTYHAYQVASLPKKLGVWARFIDTGVLPGTEPPQIQAVLTGLQAFSYRMKELLAARSVSQESFLLQELQSDMLAWRKGVEETLQKMAGEYDAGDKETLRERLVALVDHLEKRITAILDRTSEKQLSEHDYENFYRLLGSYRGVSEALVDCAGSAHSINWSRWQEERF